MRLSSIAQPGDLVTATAARFRKEMAVAADRFVRLACGQLAPAFGDVVMRLAPGAPDTPATRAWLHNINQLLAAATPDQPVPAAALLSHLEVDSPEIDRLFELLCWELAGAVCEGAGHDDIQLPDPPRLLALGVAGAFLTGDRRRSPEPWVLSPGRSYTLEGPGYAASSSVDDVMWRPNVPVQAARIRACIPLNTSSLMDWSHQEFPMVRSCAFAMDWALALARAAQVIAAYSTAAGECVAQFVRCAVPLAGGRGVIGSASREQALGLVFLPGTLQTGDLTECLLHEAMHQYLFRIEHCGDLFAATSDTREIFYSPWRSDARPLRMTLHGAFVFTAVADFYLWERAPEAMGLGKAECHRRAHYRGLQSRQALDTVRTHAITTRFGQAVCDALERDLASILERADPAAEDRIDTHSLLTRHSDLHSTYAR